MKKLFISSGVVLLLSFSNNDSVAQNVGIGTNNPLNKFQVAGNFVVTQPTLTSNDIPTPDQTKTMINGSTLLFLYDAVARLYDPGGPVGNYLPNLTAGAAFNGSFGGCIGLQVVIENLGLGTGDSLIFQNGDNSQYYLAISGDNNSVGTYIFNTRLLNILFKSNADANTGTGFSILIQQVYAETNSDVKPGFAGNTLLFDTKKGALRAGYIRDGTTGNYSVALGSSNASGDFSVGLGSSNASGENATAMGSGATASGVYSTALGHLTTASGENSTAMGYQTTASGNYSTAMGKNVRTNGKSGSFIIGDGGEARSFQEYYSDVPNQMQMVFAGGYRLYTGTAASGVYMNGGDNSWSAVSDSTKKEKLLPVDGELFLNKISKLPLTTWNYKGQSPAQYRHYGPMAQDFYNAFGKDAIGNIGCDTLINQQDFLGVNLIAIQALEKRTAIIVQLKQQNAALLLRVEELSNKLEEINKKMERLASRENISITQAVKK